MEGLVLKGAASGDGESHGIPPEDVRSYLELSYWDERFASEERYEWFKDYSHFRHLIHSHVDKQAKILELGCGNSRMSEEMYEDGFSDITATDLSSVAVKHKQQRCSVMGYHGIKVCVADILDLPFEDGSFDVVIEKGVMDVLFVDSGSPWDPKPEARNRVESMLNEAYRVLRPTGVMISIAFGQPHFRRPFFEADDFQWLMQYSAFGETFHYYFYTLQKGSKQVQTQQVAAFEENPATDMLQEHMDGSDYLLRTMIADD